MLAVVLGLQTFGVGVVCDEFGGDTSCLIRVRGRDVVDELVVDCGGAIGLLCCVGDDVELFLGQVTGGGFVDEVVVLGGCCGAFGGLVDRSSGRLAVVQCSLDGPVVAGLVDLGSCLGRDGRARGRIAAGSLQRQVRIECPHVIDDQLECLVELVAGRARTGVSFGVEIEHCGHDSIMTMGCDNLGPNQAPRRANSQLPPFWIHRRLHDVVDTAVAADHWRPRSSHRRVTATACALGGRGRAICSAGHAFRRSPLIPATGRRGRSRLGVPRRRPRTAPSRIRSTLARRRSVPMG